MSFGINFRKYAVLKVMIAPRENKIFVRKNVKVADFVFPVRQRVGANREIKKSPYLSVRKV